MFPFTATVRGAALATGVAAILAFQAPALAKARLSPQAVSPHKTGQQRSLPAFMSPEAINPKAAVLYFSDDNTNAVYLLPATNINAQPIGKITTGISAPEGLAVDTAGTLYVANSGTNSVTEYALGATQPSKTIGVNNPNAVAVSPDGTLVVASGETYNQPGWLYVYSKGSVVPSRQIAIPLNGQYYVMMGGVAIDAGDNVFLSYGDYYPNNIAQVVEYPAKSDRAINTGITGGATGLALDRRGRLYVGYPTSIEVFAPKSHTPLTTIANGLSNVKLFSVSPAGALFVPNGEIYRPCTGQHFPGNITAFSERYQMKGSNTSGVDVNPVGTALRPAQ
jgi:hypothetical protein